MPYFSIIMPAYNRQREIRRAIQSCLDQDYTDFEIVVTDDGSSDGTADVAEQFAKNDQRVRLLRHNQNRGVCPARNTAAAAAQGKWLVLLDSDMSLRTNALMTLAQLTARAPKDVGNVAARIAWDTGIVTPCPSIPSGPITYKEYISWVDTLSINEWFNCIRREVWSQGVRWPDSRAYENSFHLGLAARWRFQIFSNVCAVYHTDAPNRICGPQDPRAAKENLIRNASDHAVDCEETLRVHGKDLAQYGPRQLYAIHYQAALNNFLLGHRRLALKHCLQCIRLRPFAVSLWFIFVFGLMGPKIFRNIYSWAKFTCRGSLKREPIKRPTLVNNSV